MGTVVAPSRVSYTAVPRDILGELVQAPERRPQPQPEAVSPGGRCGPARACAVLTAAPRRPPPARDLLLRPAQPAQERLHRAAAVHAGQPGHAPGARPAPRAHQGQHVPDLLVQQGPLPLPDQRLLAAAARWVRLGRWKCVCVHEGVCLRARQVRPGLPCGSAPFRVVHFELTSGHGILCTSVDLLSRDKGWVIRQPPSCLSHFLNKFYFLCLF